MQLMQNLMRGGMSMGLGVGPNAGVRREQMAGMVPLQALSSKVSPGSSVQDKGELLVNQKQEEEEQPQQQQQWQDEEFQKQQAKQEQIEETQLEEERRQQ
eukprot:TRINITY_DN11190_c1_g1_i2.p3 TRINITY_DN11190_c1_g1~~TRINITY_DN11190_c1_g1_i2.p3  ORF type:complete len:100 (-),score=24.42 TRINITY_DN11190_c1_g1_i2:225-524(-)